MEDREIHQRLKEFAIAIIQLAQTLPPAKGAFRIADQLVGSGTSPAANAREADAARSRLEFTSCMGIALKEMREVELWLEIILALTWGDQKRGEQLLRKSRELGRILGKIIINTKANAQPK